MSLINDASLILTPNSVKEGKLYSIIPSNGNGDMTVVRATTATRVNELGLIEPTPYNLVTYSEMFADASWIKTNSATVTANTDISPNGTLTADRLTAGAAFAQVQAVVTVVPGSVYTVSVWIKRITGTGQVYLRSIENISTPITITNDWVRYSLTTTATSTIGRIGVLLQTSGDVVAIWGAQLVQGSVPKDYFYTTNRLNVPRLNYDSVGGCPSILVEPQRTNLVLRSEEFENASWIKQGVSVIANSIISPDGTMDADTITSTTTGQARVEQSFTVPAVNTTYAYSTYAKAASSPFVALTRFSGNSFAIFNLSSGTIVNQTSGVNATIISIGNGWYRISFIINALTTDTASVWKIHPCTSTDPFSSVVGNSIYLWGAQLEVGAYPTSYIPTITATTRNADIISKTGISDLIGQTEGTLFCDLRFTNVGTEKYIMVVSDSATGLNSISLRRLTSGEIRAAFFATTSSGTTNQSSAVLPNGNYKLAYTYKSGSLKLFINGVLSFTLTPTFTFGTPLSTIRLGMDTVNSLQLGDSIKSIQLYKTALTDAECIALTTL